jgi:hypothetical protein
MTSLYDTDFVKWADEQAALLTERRFDLLDLDNLIDEVTDLAGNNRRALGSAIRIAVLHLLKWYYQSERRSDSWIDSIDEHRSRAAEYLEQSPSLGTHLGALLAQAYPRSRRQAARQTRLPLATFPEACPWTLQQVLDEDFYPGGES